MFGDAWRVGWIIIFVGLAHMLLMAGLWLFGDLQHTSRYREVAKVAGFIALVAVIMGIAVIVGVPMLYG